MSLTPGLCGPPAPRPEVRSLSYQSTIIAGKYAQITARGQGQHQPFVSASRLSNIINAISFPGSPLHAHRFISPYVLHDVLLLVKSSSRYDLPMVESLTACVPDTRTMLRTNRPGTRLTTFLMAVKMSPHTLCPQLFREVSWREINHPM